MDALAANLPTAITSPTAPAGATAAQLRKSAQDFEATTLNELFEPMFDTVDLSQSEFGGGDAENSWKPILVQEMTKAIAAKGGVGLAAPVYATLLHMQEQSHPKGSKT